MWPFCKDKTKSITEQNYDALREFNEQCGGKFSYLDVDFLIVGYSRWHPRIGCLPTLVCHFRNVEGVVVTEEFDMLEFASIKKHGTYKRPV